MAHSKTSAMMVKAKEREIECLAWRSKRKSYRFIADAMGMSVAGVYEAVSRAIAGLAEVSTEKAEEVRFMELTDLDAMADAIRPAIEEGDLGAIDRNLRIQERRSRLLGLDAPTRQHITTMTHEEAMNQLDDPDKGE